MKSVTVRRGVTLSVAKFESVRLDVELTMDTDDVELVDRRVRSELGQRIAAVSKRHHVDFDPQNYGDDTNLFPHGFHQD